MCSGRLMGMRHTEETDQNEIGLMMAGLEAKPGENAA